MKLTQKIISIRIVCFLSARARSYARPSTVYEIILMFNRSPLTASFPLERSSALLVSKICTVWVKFTRFKKYTVVKTRFHLRLLSTSSTTPTTSYHPYHLKAIIALSMVGRSTGDVNSTVSTLAFRDGNSSVSTVHTVSVNIQNNFCTTS